MIGWSREIDELGWSSWEPAPADGPDVQALREHLAQQIWCDDESPAHLVEVRRGKRRQSRRGMTALYTLVFNGSGDRTLEQVYVGYEMPADALDGEYKSALDEAPIRPAIGRTVVRIPEANLLLVAFPNDRHLRVPSEEALHACLTRVTKRMGGRAGRRRQVSQVKDASFTLLRYVPGQRLTLRCCGVFESERNGQQRFAFVAKQFRKPNVARGLHRCLVGLEQQRSDSGAVRLPRPIAFDRQTGLVLMEEIPGKDLIRALGEINVGETMWAAGQMLAAFHQSPRLVRKHISVREKIDDVRGVARKIEAFFPAALPRLSACLARCLAVRWSDDVPAVLLHGAFRPKHVFVHDGTLALIDVDGMRVGHPAHDIGHFLSALSYLEAQGLLRAADRRLAVDRFLHGYAARAPWRLQPAAVLWCTAALLVNKQARKYVVHMHEDRVEKVDRVLTLAEKALAACERLGPGSALDVVGDVLC